MRTDRLTVDVLLTPEDRRARLVEDARHGLLGSPKALSPLWFYDEVGSALFEEITRLPEYYLTRAERALLEAHAGDVAALSGADTLVELGSGTSEKTRLLLDALAEAGTLRRYVPLDVSEETLRAAARDLAEAYPDLEVHAVVGDFHRHLRALPGQGRRLVAFLGSTIGNLGADERERFLDDLAASLRPGDSLLVGVDLVKSPERLIAAYDDARGVTAAFNRNALACLNRELGASFDPDDFDHVARWDGDGQRIEMYLRPEGGHAVWVEALGREVRFAPGEAVRTEISSKFTPQGFAAELARAGFVTLGAWDADGDFLLVLASRGRVLASTG
jgi:L-histidine Nalpha-methyltransferase